MHFLNESSLNVDYVFADGSFKKHCITSGGKVLLKKCDAKSLREFKKSGTNKTVGTFKYLPMWDMLRGYVLYLRF